MHGNVRTLSILSALRSRSEKGSELTQQGRKLSCLACEFGVNWDG